ncbi:tetratricopeptide repeat protein [Tenacibaculum amylolyticum]|uniref:tetratricopeptide repeat protein n=1 Tax=Tenacibaculum amylolyticum TaxID=104269 RepID=UPI003896666E
MMKKLFLLLVLVVATVGAQNANTIFSEANALYKNGEYQKAIDLYEQVVASKEISSELFYNLGNSYYKLNKVGPSIYNYEKALQLDPLNEDALNNLIFAKRLALDRIEELPKSALQKFNINYLSKLSYNQWAVITVLFSFIGAILFLLYYFTQTPARKRLFFTTSIFSFILLIISLAITYHQYNKVMNTVEAIVFVPEISVKNEPTKNAEEAFIIHEGTKVAVLDEVDDWKKIRLADGKIGWLKSGDIKVLNIF